MAAERFFFILWKNIYSSGSFTCYYFKCLPFLKNLQVCGEEHRFETLMDYFKNYEEFHIDFMVSVLFCVKCQPNLDSKFREVL